MYPYFYNPAYCMQKEIVVLKAKVAALEEGGAYKGAWSAATAYVANDTVVYCGKAYIALAASTGKKPCANPSLWSVIA